MFSRSVSHLGISVRDITQAIDFYTQALGCYLVGAPVVVHEGDGSVLGQLVTRMLGAGWGRLTIARLLAPDRMEFDLVEFEQAGAPDAEIAACRPAVIQLRARDVDMDTLARRIAEYGGLRCMYMRAARAGEEPYAVIRCQDPFGNIVEITSATVVSAFASVSAR